MISIIYCLEGGVPIGADWDPTKLSLSWSISNTCAESEQGPGPMLFHSNSHSLGRGCDEEAAAALIKELHDILETDRYPFSPP